MRKIIFPLLSLVLFVLSLLTFAPHAKAYSNNRLIDDTVFDNSGTMSVVDIQNFLNQFPNSCLKNYSSTYPDSYFNYSGSASAATIIRRAADLWGLNPQVILTKLQQEESLVKGDAGCDNWRYNSALGYNCPDTTGCNPGYAGFSQQVTKGSFQLKFNKETANGNVNWQGNGDIGYGGYMTQGSRKRCNSCQTVYYDGYYTIDGVQVHMDTGATASIYSYTPHVPSSFPGIFESFFGSTLSPVYQWSLVSQSWSRDIASLPRGETANLNIQALNTGTTTWYNSGNNPVRLGTYNPAGRGSGFSTNSWINSSRPANMQQASVAPGQTATFTFDIQATPAPGTYNEYFNLVAENVTWLNDIGQYFPIRVVAPVYSGSVVQNTYQSTIPAGSSTTSTVKLTNTGNVTWYNSGSNVVRLGTYSPVDRASPFYSPTWLSSIRPALLVEPSVPPGGTGTFNFDVKIPNSPGLFTEVYSLVAEGITWFNQPISQNYTVTGGSPITKVPVYRHYSPTRGAHFYTTDLNESNVIRTQGWNYEGIAWYASTAPNSKPVYRHYNPKVGRHFYTTDLNESNAIRSQGWNYEGIAWYGSEVPNSIPIYRHYSPARGAHFYTTDLNESNIIRSQGWNYEGIAYYGIQ